MEGQGYASEYSDTPDYGRTGYPMESVEGAQYQNRQQFTTEYGTEYGAEYGKEYGNGHHRNPLEKATDAVKDTMSDVTEQIKDRVEGAGQEIKERVEGAGQEIKERVSDMRGTMRGTAGEMRQLGEQRMMGANERMHQMERRARFEGQRRGRQVMRNLEDNPLTYGALALAAGAALALLLPQTRTENRYFGEMRDEIMERGQEAFETAKSQAQEVVAEVRPELEEKARQIVSDATEMGKEVVKDAANEMRPVVDKAISKGKEGARSAAEEIGVNPDKLTTGSKPALNRDTMAGQWKQIRGDVKSKWGKLTDDDLTRAEGDYEKLVGSIQTRYGHTREQVEREINDFFTSHKA
jgi:uncharacterized protein YjbJ (UPF0337 family)